MICNKCGSNVPAGSTNCPVCGAQVPTAGKSPFMRASDLGGPAQSSVNQRPIVNHTPSYAQRPAVNTAPPVQNRICPQCGSEMDLDSVFCANCGARFGAAPTAPVAPMGGTPSYAPPAAPAYAPPAAPAYAAPSYAPPAAPVTSPYAPPAPRAPKKNNNKIIAIIAAIVGIAAVIGVVFWLFGGSDGAGGIFGGRDEKETIKQYVDASFDGDAGKILDLFHDDVLEVALEENDMDKDEFEDYMQDMLDQMLEYYDEYGIEFVDYSIENIEDLDDDEFEELQEEYEDMLDIKIDDAKIAEVELTLECEGEERSDVMKIYLVEIDGSYYLDFMSFM